MNDACGPVRPLLDALADGELEPSRVASHLSTCPACRAELEAVRALKARLARLRLPPPPRAFRTPPLDAPPLRRPRWAAAAAAALLATVALSLAAPPPILALSAGIHDDVLEGRLVLSDLGLPRGATRAEFDGRCPCPADLGAASPFVVHRTGGAIVSLLALEESAPAPEIRARIGGNRLLAESRSGFRLIWISRLDEEALRRASERLRPPPGLSLRELTCLACCALLDVRGGGDGPISMELLTASDGSRIDPARIDSLRPAPLRR